MAHRCPIHCIVPPFVLEDMIRNGDNDERESALGTLSMDQSLRSARIHGTARMPHAPKATLLPPSDTPNRTIFDCGNNPGTGVDDCRPSVVRTEGSEPSDDPAVNEAYDGFGETYDFYRAVFTRDSIDGHGLPLNGWVHFGRDYNNAFWNSDREIMVFGDGDGKRFNRLTLSLDVIGHELTHGVTDFTANLVYLGQSGALNESMSDVFGSLIKQRSLGQAADQADWLIGADIVAEAFPGKALRSMAEPGTAYQGDPQPGHMDDYDPTRLDNYGVHINSGIPNRAFHKFATALGGNAWERAGSVWYETLVNGGLREDASFDDFARTSVLTARRLFGRDSAEAGAVVEAWQTVGIEPVAISLAA